MPLCQLSRYLGHVITPESYCLTLTKLKQSRTFQFPLAFLECVSSWDLRPIIATSLGTLLALPLHSLTRKSAEFQWTDECQVAFDLLKDKLPTTPTHRHIHPGSRSCPVLEQPHGLLHPVPHASCSLSPAKYGSSELETLAVVWGISMFISTGIMSQSSQITLW